MIDWSVTLSQRANYYAQAFPKWPAPRADDRWLDGVWFMGNDYQGSGMYGSYPPGYLDRVQCLFPEARRVLHLFSGTVARRSWSDRQFDRWCSLDVRNNAEVKPRVQGSALRTPFGTNSFDLVLADTPYSPEDAKRYDTPMPDRAKVFREAWRYVETGGVLVWLDCTHPMRRKDQWHLFGFFAVVRSTNHRYRGVSLYRRLQT